MSKTFVGARLRQLRTERKMSQVALAGRLEISASYLNQIEHDVRPLTVGLSLFGAPENGVDISLVSAATLMVVAPLLVAFLIFQRQFLQAFLTAGIK